MKTQNKEEEEEELTRSTASKDQNRKQGGILGEKPRFGDRKLGAQSGRKEDTAEISLLLLVNLLFLERERERERVSSVVLCGGRRGPFTLPAVRSDSPVDFLYLKVNDSP